MGPTSELAAKERLPRDRNRTVIFLHVPRTGGTTFTRIARRKFSANVVHTVESDDPSGSIESLAGSAAARRRTRLIVGHVDFGVRSHFPEAAYVTLLRDPVERVLSAYRYARARRAHPCTTRPRG